MIGLDTNVVVRYIAQDDPLQSPKASRLFDSLSNENPGFITLVSIVELVWVMQGCYQANKQDSITILQTLLQTQEIWIENAEVVAQALRVYAATSADFADCLIERSANHAKCTRTVTFDSKASKSAGMLLIE